MYVLQISIGNPVTNEDRLLKFRFDPTTLTAQKLGAAWPQIRAKIDELLASEATTAPVEL